VLENVKS